jgi:hypothetical protein
MSLCCLLATRHFVFTLLIFINAKCAKGRVLLSSAYQSEGHINQDVTDVETSRRGIDGHLRYCVANCARALTTSLDPRRYRGRNDDNAQIM